MWKKSLLILCVLIPAVVAAQSLSEVAKKEKKRRDKNKEKGAQVRVVTEEEVSTGETQETGEIEAEEPVDMFASDRGSSSTSTPTPTSSLSDRQREEAMWRGRMSQARSRLKAAQERYDFLSGLHLTAGEYYVDENGNPVITSLDQLRRMTAEAKAEVEAARKAIEELEREARKAGVPPGWLR